VTGLSTSAVSTLVAATVMLLWYARSSLGGLLTEAFTSPDEPDLFHEPLAAEVLAAVVGSASDRTPSDGSAAKRRRSAGWATSDEAPRTDDTYGGRRRETSSFVGSLGFPQLA